MMDCHLPRWKVSPRRFTAFSDVEPAITRKEMRKLLTKGNRVLVLSPTQSYVDTTHSFEHRPSEFKVETSNVVETFRVHEQSSVAETGIETY